MERTFRVFGRLSCPACLKARHKLEYFVNHWEVEAAIIYHDVDEPEGMTERAWYDVSEIPTILLQEGDTVIATWKEYPPRLRELYDIFNAPAKRSVPRATPPAGGWSSR